MVQRNPIFFDTESIGFYGPTIMIQYAIGKGEIFLHNIWRNPVRDTLNLIDMFTEHKDGIVGFNLTHDWYHLSKTKGVLSLLPKNKPPKVLDYLDCEKEEEAHDKYCIKPVKALDLLLYGRKNQFQSTLNQKDIRLKKVPRILADYLLETLKSRIQIPDIYFSKSKAGYEWKIEYLHEGSDDYITPEEMKAGADIDPTFCNLVLRFAPSASLKNIWKFITGEEVITYEDVVKLPKVEEYVWWPDSGRWIDVADDYLFNWENDPRSLEYAEKDVVMTRGVDDYFGNPEIGDDLQDPDSNLACAVGAMYWKGFAIDKEKTKKRFLEMDEIAKSAPINVNSPKQVKNWIWEVCSPMERVAVKSSAQEILQKIADGDLNPEAAERAKVVLKVRRAINERTLLERLLITGRLHVLFKVLGTKSDRMSGGSESYLKTKGGSINPQGIKKGDSIRFLFLLANFEEMMLSGGDFDGFEVSIAEAVYKDPLLRQELLSGKKIHGLFGAEIYEMTYEEIMATEKKNKNDPDGYYSRAKTGFFASLYGAMEEKLSVALWLAVEKTKAGLEKFANKYKKIKENQ